MSFLRKILATTSIIALCGGLVPTSQAMEEWTMRDEMMYFEGGEEFVTRVDSLLSEVPEELLMRLERRIQSITGLGEMEDVNAMKLFYLSYQTGNVLREHASKNNISQSEKEQIEAEILGMQQSFLSEIEKNINLLMTEITASIGTREMGDMSGSFQYDIPFFGNLEMSFDMKEYIADTETLEDMRLRGSFEISFTMGEESIKSSFDLDFIIRGDDIYVLIDNLDITANEEILSSSREIIEVIQALGKTKTYIHIGDVYGEMGYGSLDVLSLYDIKSQEWYKAMNTAALLTASGKISNTYFLTPQAEMCHIGKTLMAVFDPFSGGKCSAGQLEDFRENMIDVLDIRYEQNSGAGIFKVLLKGGMFSLGSGFELQTRNSEMQSLHWDVADMWEQTSFSGRHRVNRDMNFDYSVNNGWSTTEISGTFGLSETGIDSMDIVGNYSDDYTSIEGSMSLTESILKGALTGKDINDDVFVCTLDGVLETGKIEMDMNCNIENFDDEIVFIGKLDIDVRDMKNNFLIEFSSSQNESDMIRFNLQNIGVRKENVVINIPTPTKTIALEELMERVPALGNMFMLGVSGGSWEGEYEWEEDYEITYNEGDSYSETCYNYDSGEIYCYKNHDDGKYESCYDLSATTGEVYCSYSNDEYFYDGEEDVYYYFEGYMIDGETGERTDY